MQVGVGGGMGWTGGRGRVAHRLFITSCRGPGTGLGLGGAEVMLKGQARRLTAWGSFWGDLLPSWKLSDLGGLHLIPPPAVMSFKQAPTQKMLTYPLRWVGG